MDKIREEFEKQDLSAWMIRDRPIQNNNVKADLFNGFVIGYKSRDKEVKKLKNESLYWEKEYLELERKLVEAEVLKDGE